MEFLKKLKPKKNKFSEELITQNVDLELEDDAMGNLHPEDPLGDVLSFKVDYLGCLPVKHLPSEFRPEDASKFLKIENEITRRKKQRGVILISQNFFILTDMKMKEVLKVPILRISSCSLDPFNKNIFFFIRSDKNKQKTYHAFYCEKWKNAHNAALSIAHMFSQSYENYVREQQNKRFFGNEKQKATEEKESKEENQRYSLDMMDFSIDTSRSIVENTNTSKNWVSFED